MLRADINPTLLTPLVLLAEHITLFSADSLFTDVLVGWGHGRIIGQCMVKMLHATRSSVDGVGRGVVGERHLSRASSVADDGLALVRVVDVPAYVPCGKGTRYEAHAHCVAS